MSISPNQALERESRFRRLAIIGAALPVGIFIVSLFARASVELPTDSLFPGFFRAIDADSGAWIAGGILQGLAWLVIAIPLLGPMLLAAL